MGNNVSKKDAASIFRDTVGFSEMLVPLSTRLHSAAS